MQKNIAFGVLAGGNSSRMGTDKAQLKFGKNTFLEAVLIAGQDFPEQIVSFSSPGSSVPAENLTRMGVKIVYDELVGTGPMEGIRQILRHTDLDACLITATDMPFLENRFLNKLASLYPGSGNLALTWAGRIEPLCSIYSRSVLPALEALRQQNIRKPAALLQQTPTTFLALEELGFSPEVIRNINCAEEYRSLIQP